jgi:hypothetical protein
MVLIMPTISEDELKYAHPKKWGGGVRVTHYGGVLIS